MKFKLTIYTDIMINILIELTDTSSPPFLDTIFFRSSGGETGEAIGLTQPRQMKNLDPLVQLEDSICLPFPS